MKIILLGASGMVGQGVLRECLRDAEVERVLSVARTPGGCSDAKFSEIVMPDLSRIAEQAAALEGYDACFFCLGVSSVGMTEQRYTEITYDLTLTIANALVAHNPGITIIYVSGAGTDSSERGRSMWARVKGRTENALLRLPVKAAFMFRPAVIQPLHGVRSKTRIYHLFYVATAPLLALARRWLPQYVTTTEQIGRAMIKLARDGGSRQVLESIDINAV